MNYFEKKLNEYRNLEMDKRGLSNKFSFLRLVLFVLGLLICIYFWGNGQRGIAVAVFLVFGVLFLAAVVKHDSILGELARIKCKITIHENYIKRHGDDWRKFSDEGGEFVDSNHEYSSDLDIFGKGSLFQWLNVAHTCYGRRALKELLLGSSKAASDIRDRQSAVRELGKLEKFSFCEELECLGMLSKGVDKDPAELVEYALRDERLFRHKGGYFLFYLLPFITLLTVALYFFKYPIPNGTLPLLLILQMMITGIGSLKVNRVLKTVHSFKASIEAYGSMIRLIEEESFESPYLRQLKNKLYTVNDRQASDALKKLVKISDAINSRSNIVAYVFLNSLLLWDFHCIIALEEWRENYGEQISEWLVCIGVFEAISSLAVMCHLDDSWSFPTLAVDGLSICATQLGHPLIHPRKRVCNDIEVDNQISIITGSNMSGKTTLLRTIGISLVLTYAGAPVYARVFEAPILEVFTSMRIGDDLNNGISTFYAELLRIKKIIEFSKKEQPMLFLIDEIFKGTNSSDRLTGAISLIYNLNRSWIIGMISTHDFELCDLEYKDQSRISNYHFSESYAENEIHFDYKLKSGRCRTTNAKYLMRMVGIEIDEEK